MECEACIIKYLEMAGTGLCVVDWVVGEEIGGVLLLVLYKVAG